MWIERFLVLFLNRYGRRPVTRHEAGLLLGHVTAPHAPVAPVTLPDARRCEHAIIVGKTGMGKTHLLEHLALEHMRRHEGFVFFDFHGDATQALIALATLMPQAAQRLVVVDPTNPDRSAGLNPLEGQRSSYDDVFGRASELSAILRNRWNVDAFGARTDELLRNTLYTLASHDLTLVEAPHLLTSTPFRQALTARLPSAEIRSYWTDRFEPLSDAMKATFREPLLNKITGFLTVPAVRHVLGQATSTIRFDTHMRDGHWVLINLSKGQLREHAQTLGNLIFAKLQFDVLARGRLPIPERRLFSIICDEVQNLAENDLATLLTEGRKFGVSLITANQFWEQLPRVLRGALLATGTQIFFRLSAADAGVLGAELGTGHKRLGVDLTQLPRGRALMRIGGGTPQLVSVPALPRTGQREREGLTLYSLSMSKYAASRVTVERDIDQRRTSTVSRQDGSDTVARRTSNHDEEGQANW